MILLDLGASGLLLGLELKYLDLLAGLAGALTGGHQGSVGVALGRLGSHDSLASLHDARVHLGASMATELAEKSTAAAAGAVH